MALLWGEGKLSPEMKSSVSYPSPLGTINIHLFTFRKSLPDPFWSKKKGGGIRFSFNDFTPWLV